MTIVPDGELCRCGNRGCLETVASAEAILQQCRKAASEGESALLAAMLQNGTSLTLETAAQAAHSGDTVVTEIFRKAADYAGIAIANTLNLINPFAVILGGELPQYTDLYFTRMVQTINRHAWDRPVDVRVSTLGSDSAAVGAASLFIRKVFFQVSEKQANRKAVE